MIRIEKGLDIPVSGKPVQTISYGPDVRHVAVVAEDFVGLRPALKVAEGDRVRLGQVLLTDKRHPEIRFTAPGSGVVSGVHRAEKRRLVSVAIELDGDDQEAFPTHSTATVNGEEVRGTLTLSGLWTALRTRPFNRVPDPESEPHSIFVTAMDTNPLAADPGVVLSERGDDFVLGLRILTKLTQGTVHVCHAAEREFPGGTCRGCRCRPSRARTRPGCRARTFIFWLRSVRVGRCGSSAIRT